MPKNTQFMAAVMLLVGYSIPFSGAAEPTTKRNSIDRYVVAAKVPDRLYAVSVKDVNVGGEIGRRIDATIDANIKTLHFEKNFLAHFEQKSGPDVAGAFVGMGMLIDACVRFAASSRDPEMVSIKNKLIAKVTEAQLPNGYSGFYKPERRLWNTPGRGGDNWDIHEMAFLIDGLVTDYQLFGNERSLKSAIKTADFILTNWHEMPDDYAATVDLHVLNTGIDWAILKLYRVTGEKRFLNFSEKLKSLYAWKTEIEIGRRTGVSGHMFAYFAMCYAQLELYRLTENDELLKQTEKAINFFIAKNGLTITGSAGQREIWTDDQDGEGHLGETCATAYQIRVYENLLRLTGNSLYGDLIERTLFNGLFGAQSPDGDELRYFTPFEGPREYYPHEHMCCPGNFRRIVSELPGMIYYSSANNGVAVSLFTASSATVNLDDGTKVRLSQDTDYPSSGHVELLVSPDEPSSFPLLLRIPSWAKQVQVAVNGQEWNTESPAGLFLTIERTWSPGDKVVLDFQMDFRFVKGRRRNSGRVALMRGPVIYGLNLEANPAVTANGKRTFYDLRRILLDPTTLSGPETDHSVRPNGTAAYVSGWRENYSGKADRNHEFRMKLTEFPDPDNVFIYFKVPDYSIEVEDELVDPSGMQLDLSGNEVSPDRRD